MEVVHTPPPRRVTPLRVLAVVVVLLAVGGAATWLWPRGDEPAGDATAAAHPSPAPAEDPDDPDDGDVDHDAGQTEIDRIAAQIAEVRRLDLQRPVEARFEPLAELVTRIEALTGGEGGATGSQDSRTRMLETLGLLPPGTDIAAALRTIYDETLIGFYVPAEERLYVNQSAEVMTPGNRWASAHEVSHALQDQHFDLGGLLDVEVGALDQELARTSLVEGDAVITQVTWAQRFLTSDEQAQLGDDTGPIGVSPEGRLFPYVVARFVFPYEAGPEFVAALLAAGHLEAVDEALRHPPTTSAQILHPQRYLDGIEAVDVPMAADPGDGWDPGRRDEFGEFDLRQLLDPVGVERAADLATGWAGGQARSFTRGADTAVGVGLVFDTAEQAGALCAALPVWWAASADGTIRGDGVGDSPDGWLAYRCTGTRVDLARAPGEAAVRALTERD
ncbi:MAG: hypothetical protein WD250_17130 [Egibacteraceae bacterium]